MIILLFCGKTWVAKGGELSTQITGSQLPYGVLVCHEIKSSLAEAQLVVDGECRSIWGKTVRVVPTPCPHVVLYAQGSTPSAPQQHPTAVRQFQEYAERLVKDGVEFYTFLRPEWAVPAVRWSKHPR